MVLLLLDKDWFLVLRASEKVSAVPLWEVDERGLDFRSGKAATDREPNLPPANRGAQKKATTQNVEH